MWNGNSIRALRCGKSCDADCSENDSGSAVRSDSVEKSFQSEGVYQPVEKVHPGLFQPRRVAATSDRKPRIISDFSNRILCEKHPVFLSSQFFGQADIFRFQTKKGITAQYKNPNAIRLCQFSSVWQTKTSWAFLGHSIFQLSAGPDYRPTGQKMVGNQVANDDFPKKNLWPMFFLPKDGKIRLRHRQTPCSIVFDCSCLCNGSLFTLLLVVCYARLEACVT